MGSVVDGSVVVGEELCVGGGVSLDHVQVL